MHSHSIKKPELQKKELLRLRQAMIIFVGESSDENLNHCFSIVINIIKSNFSINQKTIEMLESFIDELEEAIKKIIEYVGPEHKDNAEKHFQTSISKLKYVLSLIFIGDKLMAKFDDLHGCMLIKLKKKNILNYLPDVFKEDFAKNISRLNNNQFKALCYSLVITLRPNSSQTWQDLGHAFSEGVKIADLPYNFPEEWKRKTKGKTEVGLVAFCYGMAIIHQPCAEYAWRYLGDSFLKGAKVTDLPDGFPEEFKKEMKGKTASNLKAFCLGMSIIFTPKSTVAWGNLGDAFLERATAANLPDGFPKEWKKEINRRTKSGSAAFCYGTAIIYKPYDKYAWEDLSRAFSKGANVTDLPDGFPEELKNEMKGKTKAGLKAFCLGFVIVHKADCLHFWKKLGGTFLKGAKVTDLPNCFPEELKNEMKEKTEVGLATFCYGMPIICMPKNQISWRDLGDAFLKGAKATDLPDDFPEEFKSEMKGKTEAGLAAFCYGIAIINRPNSEFTWQSLGETFLKGANVTDLPDAFPEELKNEMKEKTEAGLAAFCHGTVIIHKPHYSYFWSDLGDAFSNKAKVTDLPNRFPEELKKIMKEKTRAGIEIFCYGMAVVHDIHYTSCGDKNKIIKALSDGAKVTDLPDGFPEELKKEIVEKAEKKIKTSVATSSYMTDGKFDWGKVSDNFRSRAAKAVDLTSDSFDKDKWFQQFKGPEKVEHVSKEIDRLVETYVRAQWKNKEKEKEKFKSNLKALIQLSPYYFECFTVNKKEVIKLIEQKHPDRCEKLFEEAINDETLLGNYFRLQRGSSKPNLRSGCLRDIQNKLAVINKPKKGLNRKTVFFQNIQQHLIVGLPYEKQELYHSSFSDKPFILKK